MKTKKILLIVITLIISIMFLNLNKVYAEEGYAWDNWKELGWDEFYEKFRFDADEGNGNPDKIPMGAIDRMIAGPTEDERGVTALVWGNSADIEYIQNKAKNIKQARLNNETDSKTDSETDSEKDDSKSNMTNKERKEIAKQKRKYIIDYLGDKDISTLDTNTIRTFLKKIVEYKEYSGTDLDDDLSNYYSQLNAELGKRGEKQDTTLFDNQTGNDGEIKSGVHQTTSTIGTDTMGRVDRDASHTLGEIITEGDKFISQAKDENIKQEDLKKMSDTIYNILLVVGIIVAVIVGLILGIKFMAEGVEGKAEMQKAFVPYIIGCIVVFGAFIIWKIVVEVLQTM